MRITVLVRAGWASILCLAACATGPGAPVASHTDAPNPQPPGHEAAPFESLAVRTPLRGRVTRAVDGQPVADARVCLWRWNELTRAEELLTATASAADGSFALEAPSLRSVWVVVEVPGFEGARAVLTAPFLAYRPMASMDMSERDSFEPVALPGEIPPLDVALTPGVTAAVSVHGRDGTPRAGLDVEAMVMVSSAIPSEYKAWEWHPAPAYVVHGRTDADGACTFSTLPPGAAFQLTVLHDGKRVCEGASPMGMRAGERRAFDFAVGPFARIAGRAVDPQGAPVAGQELWLVDPHGVEQRTFSPVTNPVARTTSAADGAFAFEEVPEGTWLVGPAWTKVEAGAVDSSAVAACAQRVEIAPGAAVVAVDVPVWRGLYVTGRVLDQGGAGLDGLLVRAFAADESGYHFGATSPGGDFVLGPLTGGEYELGISDLSNTWRSEPFVARAGEQDVELRLARAGRVRCTVVDPAGAEARVLMTTAWTPPGATAESEIEGGFRDGAFELAGLGPGRYQVLALDHQRKLAAGATVDLDAGEQREVRITLQPAAELVLRNSSAEPVIIACSAAGGLWRTYDLPPTAWVGPLVPPGPVEVRVTDKSGAELARKSLTFASGVDQTYTYPAP